MKEKQTVLFVDDDKNLLHGFRRSLHKDPYRILVAASGEEGLERLRAQNVDVVIADYAMPRMDGNEFLAKVLQEFPDVIRFMLTGNATLRVAIEAINRGAISRFFVKPCNAIELRQAIKSSLEQRELLLEARRLLQGYQRQAALLRELERENPGITSVERDLDGAIRYEEYPTDLGAFVGVIRSTISEA